jgi:PAS domain S-box-containing protein
MYDFKQIFYLYAILTPQGLIYDIGGKALAEAETEPVALVGKKFSELLFWQSNEATAETIANSIKISAEGKPLELELNLQLGPEKLAVVRASFTPNFDEQEQIHQIFFSSIEVTPYKQEIEFHKKRSERFLYAAENADIGLWFWDLKKDEIYTTPKFNELYGLSSEFILTFEKFKEIVYPEDLPRVQMAINHSHQNLSEYNIEYRVKLENGRVPWISVRGKTFNEENSPVMMGSARDVTYRKMMDERLKQLVLAEKIVRDELEEANRAKDHFMALVSHELRSPLNSILGWTKILLSKEVDEKTKRNALETIEKSANVQAKLISDLVDSSKIISGKMNLSFYPVNLKELVKGVYEAQKPLAEEKHINFVLNDLPELTITGDSGRLRQVFTNLISNSLKFTPENGEISISLKKENNVAIYSVTDSGCGIPENDLPSIFKQYYQVERSTKKDGLGLGLSIVKSIVDKHSGTVSVRNNEGAGCTFSVHLPILFSTQKESQEVKSEKKNEPALTSPNKLKNIDILIVEDNDDSREVLQFYLNQLGAKTISASSAKEGLDYLITTSHPPTVIISDISMPEEDGYSFIHKVRNLPDEKIRQIPAIALTAFASKLDQQKSLEAGFQCHHPKPFEPSQLVDEILEIVSE